MCLPNHIHKVELQQREDSVDQVTLAGDQEQIVAQLVKIKKKTIHEK